MRYAQEVHFSSCLCVNVDFFFAIELKSRFLHVMVGNRSVIDMEFAEIMIYNTVE